MSEILGSNLHIKQTSDTCIIFLISNKWWYGTKITQDVGMSGRECMDQWRIFKKNVGRCAEFAKYFRIK